jgi:hypothetical protein
MLLCFEITYGRFLNNTANMIREAEENDKVLIPRKQIQVYIIREKSLN